MSLFGTIVLAQSSQTEIQSPPSLSFESIGSDDNTRYISDDLFLYLRAGPGKNYRLRGSMNAGSRVTLLNIDQDAGFAEVVDDRQRKGWVEIQYINRNPSIRIQLETLQLSMQVKEKAMKEMQIEVEAVTKNLVKFDEQKSSLNRQITQQLEEIARLNEKITQQERANNMQWFTRGAILAGVSVFAGYLMGLFGRKRSNNGRLM